MQFLLLWIKVSVNNLLLQLITYLQWLFSFKIWLKEDTNYPLLELELERRPWSNLPNHLLELLSFRGTCKEWRHSSKASADRRYHQTESSITSTTITTCREKPWFLLYGTGESPNCKLYDPCSKKIYTKLDIPELGEGVECLAYTGGWLLRYKKSNRSVFFFCPFSRARIDLPNLPKVGDEESLVYHRIAAFSSPPTSPDCIVIVGTQSMCRHTSPRRDKFAVDVIRRGNNEWDFHHERGPRLPGYSTDRARIATFWKGSIYFLDLYRKGISFSLETKQWEDRTIVLECVFRVTPWRGYFRRCNGIDKGKLGLKETDSLSICGTELQGDDRRIDNFSRTCIFYEEIKGDVEGIMKLLLSIVFLEPARNRFSSGNVPRWISRKHKGVWINPRFFQLPPDYSW